MTDKLTTVQIHDQATLTEACDLLHDASFDLSSAQFDRDACEWRGVFHRELHDRELIKKTSRRVLLLFRRYKIPLVESELRLSGVRDVEVSDRSRIGNYTLNKVSSKGDRLRLIFCEDMEIALYLRKGSRNRPAGKLTDSRLLGEYRSGLAFWPFPLFGFKWWKG